MTYREMLELAAKAYGLKNHAWDGTGMRELAVHGVPACGFQGPIWNPHDDDGDALRLAVKLSLTVCNEHLSAGVAQCIGDDGTAYPTVLPMTDTGDEINEADYAATRQAIVRAAAEIGKQMVAAQGEQ